MRSPSRASSTACAARPPSGPGGWWRWCACARERLDAGDSPEQVLWTLWDGTDWGSRLRHQTELGGQSARLAHRDLDAICALFDAAARSEEQSGHVGLREFLDTLSAQEIPADTLAERGVRGDAVRLLTAHRSKGLEWDLVVVAHVQEGAWPDLRRRNTLLGADRIGRDGLVPPLDRRRRCSPRSAGCSTSRRPAPARRLVVTAVASPDDDGEQPSRFLRELGAGSPSTSQGRPRRPLSLAGLVADLRRTAADPAQPDDLRRAAAHRLAALAATEVHGRPARPGRRPRSWWGLRTRAVHDAGPARGRAGALSASALQGWSPVRRSGSSSRRPAAPSSARPRQGFGIIVHALADRVAKGELAPGPDLMTDLMALVDDVWDRMSFRTPWSGDRERVAVARRAGPVRRLADASRCADPRVVRGPDHRDRRPARRRSRCG